MSETLFEELRRYVGFEERDEAALREFHGHASPEFARVADVFYRRILDHSDARAALEGGEAVVGRLKITLQAWMDKLLSGPWDEAYYQLRCRIGRMHVRIALPQHYMFGAMNVLRQELNHLIDRDYLARPAELKATRTALGKILDLELAIMLHTYREDLLAQQARVERLSTFGQLVGSLGHELRNPLGVIESSLFLLKGRVGEDPRGVKHVDRISEQVGIANSIVTDLLDMIREQPLQREPVRLAEVLEHALALVTRPDKVALRVEGLAELPPISADASQLRQVFVNLLQNAMHAAAPAGEVRVSARMMDPAAAVRPTPDGPEEPEEKIRAGSERAPSAQVELVFSDTGPGVDAAIRARLFEPLVTTKAKGIGLGLALVKRIVERHGGTIGYQPAPTGGARFVLRLPRE